MNQKELIALRQALAAGDNSSLGFIFDQHADFCIENLVYKNACSRQDAEDIFVDSLLIFRENVINGKVTYLTDVRNYVYTTCRNQYLARLQNSQMRDKKLKQITPKIEHTDEENPLIMAEQLEQQEKMIQLSKEAFELLNEKCQKILNLFYVKKLSLKEIADQMGAGNAGVVKTNKYRCLSKLSQLMDELKTKKGIK